MGLLFVFLFVIWELVLLLVLLLFVLLLIVLLVKILSLMLLGVSRAGCCLLCAGANLVVGDKIVVSPSSATHAVSSV